MWIKKIIILVVIITLQSCKKGNKNADLDFVKEIQVIEYLKKSELTKAYCKEVLGEEKKITFSISSRNIYPKLIHFNDAYVDNTILSLAENYTVKNNPQKKLLTDNENAIFKLFFSTLSKDMIYCELFWNEKDNLSYSDNHFSYNGLSLQFLFSFNSNQEIIKVLENELNYR